MKKKIEEKVTEKKLIEYLMESIDKKDRQIQELVKRECLPNFGYKNAIINGIDVTLNQNDYNKLVEKMIQEINKEDESVFTYTHKVNDKVISNKKKNKKVISKKKRVKKVLKKKPIKRKVRR